MQTIDLSPGTLAFFYLLLVVPLWICLRLGTGMVGTVLVAVARMTLQLVLVALYLEVIFRLNSLWLNAAWMAVMLLVANASITRSAGLRMRRFFLPVLGGLCAGTLPVVVLFVCVGLRPEPVYDARYLIPITGMVLGNCLRGNVISLERFYTGIREREQEYLARLLMGATVHEAVRPFLAQAMRAALGPTVSTMATLGLVSLPGMMTGQILGGSDPAVAIRYQIAIMLAIFCATAITTAVNIRLSLPAAFTDYHTLDSAAFTRR